MSAQDFSGVGPVALVGSGEFLPQMVDVDRRLLDGRAPRAAFLPTAAGQEGPASIRHWLSLGTDHYRGMGVEPIPVPVLDREDADDASFAERVADVGLIYLSGGNPGYVAATLRDSLVWQAIVAAWRAGAALAGCSAGAMALTAEAPSVRGPHTAPTAGLGLIGHLAVIPHFDRVAQWDAGYLQRRMANPTPGVTVVGIDEDTALVGGPFEWTVMGRQGVTVFGADGPRTFEHGQKVTLGP